jgi:hypothetical protein
LRAFDKDELVLVIMSVDVKGSTKPQTTADRKTFSRTINALLTEMGELVARFHGHVLMRTGDGLIAYSAEPTFIIKSDAAVDCAYGIRRLICDAVNRSSSAPGCRRSTCGSASRLGLDGGEAATEILGSDKTKRHADLIGEVVGLACKIESRAGPTRSSSARPPSGTCTSAGASCASASSSRPTGRTPCATASATRSSASTGPARAWSSRSTRARSATFGPRFAAPSGASAATRARVCARWRGAKVVRRSRPRRLA